MLTTTAQQKYTLRVFSRYVNYYPNPPVETVYTNTAKLSNVSSGLLKRETYSNPSWRTLVALGQDASQPYFNEWASWCFPVQRGSGYVPNPPRWILTDGTIVWSGDVVPITEPNDASLADLALKRLKNKLSSEIENYKLIAPLVEIRDLRKTIVDSVHLTIGFLEKVATIKKNKGRGMKKLLREAWLTYSFGIMPTIADVNNLASAVQSFLDKKDRFVRLTGTAKTDWISSSTSEASFLLRGNVTSVVGYYHKLSYRYVAGLKVNVESENDYTAASHFGVTLGEIVPALWELTAFSWMADYFSTVGDWLEDTFSSHCETTTYVNLTKRYSVDATIFYLPKPLSGTMSLSGGNGTYNYGCIRRETFSSLPTRQLRFKSADEIGVNSVARLLNLISLVSK